MNNEEPVVPGTPTEPVTPPAGETADAKLARLEETNKKLYERAKAAEAQAKELKAKVPLSTPEKPKVEEEVVEKVNRLEQIEKKRQFGYQNNLSPEETDLLFRYAGEKDPTETLKDDVFKDLLEVRRKRDRVAKAIPSSSNRSTSIDGKTFKDMTAEERKANWSKMMPQ